MIKVTCPTGCAGVAPVLKPWRLRDELVVCRNCTATFRIPENTPDGETVAGTLVARPGEAAPAAQKPASVPLLRAQWLGIGIAVNGALGLGSVLLIQWAERAAGGPAPSAALACWAFGPAIGLAHVLGGFVTGWRSPGETLSEPALAGAVVGGVGAFLVGGAAALPLALPAAALAGAVLSGAGGFMGERFQKS